MHQQRYPVPSYLTTHPPNILLLFLPFYKTQHSGHQIPGARNTGVCHHDQFHVMVKIKPRDSCTHGKHHAPPNELYPSIPSHLPLFKTKMLALPLLAEPGRSTESSKSRPNSAGEIVLSL